MNPNEIAAAIQAGPAIIQAIGFLLAQFKHGPVKDEAAQHLQAVAQHAVTLRPDIETGKVFTMPARIAAPAGPVNVETSTVDNNPGEHAVVTSAGETFGEQYTTLTVQGPEDLQSQLLGFEQALGQVFEVIGYRVPELDQVVGVNREVVGALAGATGDVQHDRMALIAQVGSPDAGALVPINVQVKVERLVNQKQSDWLSFKQVMEGGF
jgi:hypothetical protein